MHFLVLSFFTVLCHAFYNFVSFPLTVFIKLTIRVIALTIHPYDFSDNKIQNSL